MGKMTNGATSKNKGKIMPNYHRVTQKGGTYFFTLTLENRNQTFLIDYIDLLRQAFQETQQRYPFETLAICILPDHLHWIMRLPENDSDYAIRIRLFKTLFSRRLPEHCRLQNLSKQKRGDLGIWQRRFWEHCIQNEHDLARHMDYVYYNPVKHGYVENVADWAFSSFHRDVKRGLYPQNWGNNLDIQTQNLYRE